MFQTFSRNDLPGEAPLSRGRSVFKKKTIIGNVNTFQTVNIVNFFHIYYVKTPIKPTHLKKRWGKAAAQPATPQTDRSDPIRKPYRNQQVAVTEEGSRREQLLCKCGKLNNAPRHCHLGPTYPNSLINHFEET